MNGFSRFVSKWFVTVFRESVGEVGTERAQEPTEQQAAVDMSVVSAGKQ